MKNKETKFVAPNQNLFNAMQKVANFTALQSDMQEIIDAVDKDRQKVNLTQFQRIVKPDENTILIAKNECLMNNGNIPALIIGKEYKIKGVFSNKLVVSSEVDKNHYFEIDKYTDYFTIK